MRSLRRYGRLVQDTIPAALAVAAERYGDRVWLRTDDGVLSFRGAKALVARATVALADAGVEPGDRVLMTARTSPDYLLCWFATCALGAIAAPCNPESTEDELRGLIAQVRPRLAVADPDTAPLVTHAGAKDVVDVATVVGDWHEPPETPVALPLEVEPSDVAVLIPTSGTTGRSKLVMQTHRAYAWAGEGFAWWMRLGPDDRLLTCLPLFHINAPAYSVMGSLACGAGLILQPRFSASRFLDAARRHGATEFNAIGAMLEILMRQPERPDDGDTALRLVYTGPSPAREWQEAFEQRFGLQVVCGYAMSESPYGLIWPHGERPFGTLGKPRQHPRLGEVNEARVVDGELLLRNPVVTPGYWEMPEETAATVVGGWLHTGDLVTENQDGTYTFVSRKKEVLRRRGENLSPAEVEEAVAAHPDVLECAVVGVPSELTEDDVKAFVVATPGHDVDFEQLRAWTVARISAFKVPRYWQLIDALPRTPTSRVAKHLLPIGHPDGEYDADSANQEEQL